MLHIIFYGFCLYLGIYACQRLIRFFENRVAGKEMENLEAAEKLLAQFDKEKKS